MSNIQAVDLLISQCDKEITAADFGLDELEHGDIHYQLQKNAQVKRCSNLPFYIIKLANAMNDNELCNIGMFPIIQSKKKEKS